MTALTTLEGLADGTDLTVRPDQYSLTRLKVREGRIENLSGKVIDPWFLAGHLREGNITIGDFRPPQVGEWWIYQSGPSYRVYQVIDIFERDGRPYVEFAVYRRESFVDFIEQRNDEDLFSLFSRTTAPTWAGHQTLDLSGRLWRMQKERDAANARATNATRIASHLRYAKDYLDSAINIVNETR